ncbi:malonyl CoA-ACP transacylase [Chondromyces crocatus]|uniref:Malonyl CoA-acyl carrier protein transacylase n=2 Tax=Chondromyces crocatus TaxID=52 RepID=A0A0K1EGZ4_CHOCO|nr:malonyl CoA-ACP transacylase [Chondromyces crocatus]
MGKALAESSEAARDVFRQADAALGEPLSRLCFEGPIEELTLTRNTQPALVAASCATLAALRERYPELGVPVFAAGHSLGEYSALVAAGALSLEDAVRLCRLRGEAMQEAVPAGQGGMAAVMGVDAPTLKALCEEAAQGEIVSAANYNGPGQTVIAGHASAVSRVGELVAKHGGKMVVLKVSAPFHCALMRPAAERLDAALAETRFGALAFPVIANVSGEPNGDPGEVRSLLVEQVASPVQWLRTIERMVDEGVTHALEIGPGKVLAGLVKRISKQIKVLGVNDPATVESVASFLA